jgi:hypothetical protein
MSSQLITHAKNKDRHPGMPDLPAPRRSNKIVQEECAAMAAVAGSAQEEQETNIREVAAIEDELVKSEVKKHTNFKNPISKGTKVRATQPKKTTRKPEKNAMVGSHADCTLAENEPKENLQLRASDGPAGSKVSVFLYPYTCHLLSCHFS